VDAHAGYIYVRGEYRYLIEVLEKAIAEAYEKGWLGKNIQGTGFDFDLYAHTGAALTSVAKNRRCWNRSKASVAFRESGRRFRGGGRVQCPTVLNNVETYCAVPAILRDGGAAFAALGIPNPAAPK